MAKLSTEELLESFKEMTLIELSEFVSQFEETFNVTAAAPVAVAGAAPAAGGGNSTSVTTPPPTAASAGPSTTASSTPGCASATPSTA